MAVNGICHLRRRLSGGLFASLGLFGAGVMASSNAVAPPAGVAYVLQYEKLGRSREEVRQRLASCGREWLVLEPAVDSGAGAAGRWSHGELDAIRAAYPGRRLLSYLSIGEAEDYRDYWVRAWDARRDGQPDPGAPRWLLPQNPEWKGNYRVRYWSPEWQALVLAELDRCFEAGFDGLYLDLVDAFENFEYDASRREWIEHRTNPETGRTYRRDMVDWVRRIAQRARERRPAAILVAQNGEALLADPDFREAIDAVAIEDLWSNGHRRHNPNEVAHRLAGVRPWRDAEGIVFVIEYAMRADLRAVVLEAARRERLPVLLTDRELRTLGEWHPPAGTGRRGP